MKPIFVEIGGRKVWQSGVVTIENVLHLVRGGFIKCNPDLNCKAWNTTTMLDRCKQCFKPEAGTQLSLFEQ